MRRTYDEDKALGPVMVPQSGRLGALTPMWSAPVRAMGQARVQILVQRRFAVSDQMVSLDVINSVLSATVEGGAHYLPGVVGSGVNTVALFQVEKPVEVPFRPDAEKYRHLVGPTWVMLVPGDRMSVKVTYPGSESKTVEVGNIELFLLMLGHKFCELWPAATLGGSGWYKNCKDLISPLEVPRWKLSILVQRRFEVVSKFVSQALVDKVMAYSKGHTESLQVTSSFVVPALMIGDHPLLFSAGERPDMNFMCMGNGCDSNRKITGDPEHVLHLLGYETKPAPSTGQTYQAVHPVMAPGLHGLPQPDGEDVPAAAAPSTDPGGDLGAAYRAVPPTALPERSHTVPPTVLPERRCHYKVQPGDDLSEILKAGGTDRDLLDSINGGGPTSRYWKIGSVVLLTHGMCEYLFRRLYPQSPLHFLGADRGA